MTDQERLEQLLQAHHACIAIVTHEEDYALGLVREASFNQVRELMLWSMNGGLRNGLTSSLPEVPNTEHPAAAFCHLLQREEICDVCMLDLVGHLRDERTLRLLRDVIHRFRKQGRTLTLIDHRDELPPAVQADATRFDVTLPDEKELEEIVRRTLQRLHREQPIRVSINRKDLRAVIKNLRGLTRLQAEQVIVDSVIDDRRFDIGDLNHILAGKRQALCRAGLLEYVETPVDLSQIGGLARLKAWLKQRAGALSDDAAAFGLTAPRGILLIGVQGAGKSLCAKAIAAAWQRPLLRMDPCALYDRYVGESERRLRDSLKQAEMMAPIVLWVDEIEKGFASAASHSTDGGLSQRMFGTLLTWMQERVAPVFLVATANDIEALPPELLRKGRFDEIFFVDLPEPAVRKEIFAIHIKKRGRDPKAFDLKALAEAADGYSGAEIEQAILAALHEAFATGRDLSTESIVQALAGSPPLSVTMAERVQALRDWARTRCTPAC